MKKMFLVLLYLVSCGLSAVVPQSIYYQGVLTDAAGIPVSAPTAVNIEIRVFDAATSGTQLYSESHNGTALDNGVFALSLGGGSTPTGSFDAATFANNSTWLELVIDGEVQVPRQAFLSVPYALHAGDSVTLDGQSAGNYDQSLHTTDNGNPHGVSAAQIGAASAGTLSSHESNSSAHHVKTTDFAEITSGQVTAAQIGVNAVGASEIATNAVGAAEIGLDAVGSYQIRDDGVGNSELADGAVTDIKISGPISSSKITTSGLDSDLLDGLHANELIDAAADEVRTPIDSLPFIISTSGSYYLTGNLTNGNGIDVNVDDVTIDLMGFTLSGDGTTDDYGINLDARSNVTIRNGTVREFGNGGIYQADLNPGGHYNRVLDVQVLGNGTLGNTGGYSGIYLRGDNNYVGRCTTANNGGAGIQVGRNSNIIGNTAHNNGLFGIYGDASSNLSGNTSFENADFGIYAGTGSNISGNTVFYNNGLYGIYGLSANNVTNNSVWNNFGGGIYGGVGATISSNTVYLNRSWGIFGIGGNSIQNNTVQRNNTIETANQGGIRVGTSSRVIGNTVDFNEENSIYVDGVRNVIEDNLVTSTQGTGNGINFVGTDNFYANNRATNNAINYAGNVPTGGGDGGGNASF